MPDLDKKPLSDSDNCSKFITPALVSAVWDVQTQVRAKVDEFMAVLDALEATLTTARTASEKLFAANIAKLHAV